MRHELDIADVEARTKIRAKYLRALENEEFGVLPGPTTVRSFIRTYAELLGLDPHPLVEEYRASNEDREEAELQPVPAAPRASGRRERREPRERRPSRPSPPPRVGGRGPSPLMLIGGTILAVLVALAIIGLIGGEEEGGGNDRASQDADTTQARQKPKPKPKPKTPTVATVNVAPTVPTYACVDTGPGTEIVFEGTLDSARRFRGKRVRLNLGKTSVKLTANGKPVPIEPLATPVGYDVTPQRVEELEPGQRPCA